MFLTPTVSGDLLIIAIIGLMAWHFVHLREQHRWMLLDPLNTFWAGILVCYVGQPLLAGDIFIAWHSPAVFDKTLLAALVGLIFVLVGYEARIGVELAQKIPRLPPVLSSGKLLIAAVVLIVVGLLGYAYVISLSGGLNQWLSVGRGGTDFEKVQGYLPELTQALPAGVSILLLRAGLNRIPWTGKLVAWGAGAAMWWWFLYLGSRSRLIMFSIVLLAAYYLPIRKSPPFALVALFVFLMFPLVKLQEYYRGQFTNLSLNLTNVDEREMWGRILPVFLGGDRELQRSQLSPGSEFNCGMSVVDLVPEHVPYNYGYGFLEILTRPIPRRLWPNKVYPHIESVQGVLREAGLSEATVASAQQKELLMGPAFCFVGHWYYVGGFVGLIIGGSVTGILLRTIRGFHDVSPGNHGMIIVYPFLLSLGFAEAASTPWYWFYTLPFVLLPFLVVIYWTRELPRGQARPLRARRRNTPISSPNRAP